MWTYGEPHEIFRNSPAVKEEATKQHERNNTGRGQSQRQILRSRGTGDQIAETDCCICD